MVTKEMMDYIQFQLDICNLKYAVPLSATPSTLLSHACKRRINIPEYDKIFPERFVYTTEFLMKSFKENLDSFNSITYKLIKEDENIFGYACLNVECIYLSYVMNFSLITENFYNEH